MVGQGKVLLDTFWQLDVALCDNVEELWASVRWLVPRRVRTG